MLWDRLILIVLRERGVNPTLILMQALHSPYIFHYNASSYSPISPNNRLDPTVTTKQFFFQLHDHTIYTCTLFIRCFDYMSRILSLFLCRFRARFRICVFQPIHVFMCSLLLFTCFANLLLSNSILKNNWVKLLQYYYLHVNN